MNALAAKVKRDRARRNAARASFETRVTQIRSDLDPVSLGGRIAEKAVQESRETLDEALKIASESKGVVLGTLGALALWFLRNPILNWSEALYTRAFSQGEGMEDSEGLQPEPTLSDPVLAQDNEEIDTARAT